MELTFTITDFKSIAQASLPLRQGLNILVGPNGAGKTCLFSALKYPRDLLLHGAARAVARAGGPKRVLRRGSSRFSLSITTSYGKRTFRRRPQPYTLSWHFTVALSDPDGIPTLITEHVHLSTPESQGPVFAFGKELLPSGRVVDHVHLSPADDFGRDLFTSWKYQYHNVRKADIERTFASKLRDLARKLPPDNDRSLLPLLTHLDQRIAQLSSTFLRLDEYNISPDLAREPTEPLHLPIMQSDGEGVAEVIYALENEMYAQLGLANQQGVSDYPVSLWRHGRHWELRPPYVGAYFISPYGHPRRRKTPSGVLEASLANIVRELAAGVQPLDGIATKIDPTTGKRFVIFRAGDQEFYPEEVSDGTIKWLCLLTSIFVPSSVVYLLEEPENFLHPWMQQRLVDTMRRQAKTVQTMFVLTSHSATVLNAALPDEVFVVTHSASGTQVAHIQNRAEVDSVLDSSSFRLGDLWVSGALSGVPANAE